MPSERNPVFRLTDAVTATVMGAGSALRDERVFHPQGVAHRVTVEIRSTSEDPSRSPLGVPLLDEPGSYDGVVRFSRGGGLPEPLPDVLGVAVRILDAHGPGRHQDVLAGSSLELPFGRQLLVPSIDFAGGPWPGTTLSSVLPYRIGVLGTGFLGATIRSADGRHLTHLRELTEAVAADDLRFELRYATRFGAWYTFADVRVGNQLPPDESEALSFNVDDNTGGGLEPRGWLQALRRHAYAASQAARPR
jgi:hypothetical protein